MAEVIEGGYVTLARKITGSRLWALRSPSDFKLAIYCILKANYERTPWDSGAGVIIIERGQFPTGYDKLAKDTMLTREVVRGGLRRLVKVGFLTLESTPRGSIVTVVNYETYQNWHNYINTQPPTPPTPDQHPANTPPTLSKEGEASEAEHPLAQSDEKPVAAAPTVPPVLVGLSLYESDEKLCRKLTAATLDAWRKAYPGVDIEAEIAKAHAWEIANPEKRKKNRVRFLNGWLSRAQDKGGGPARGSSEPPPAIFPLPPRFQPKRAEQ